MLVDDHYLDASKNGCRPEPEKGRATHAARVVSRCVSHPPNLRALSVGFLRHEVDRRLSVRCLEQEARELASLSASHRD